MKKLLICVAGLLAYCGNAALPDLVIATNIANSRISETNKNYIAFPGGVELPGTGGTGLDISTNSYIDNLDDGSAFIGFLPGTPGYTWLGYSTHSWIFGSNAGPWSVVRMRDLTNAMATVSPLTNNGPKIGIQQATTSQAGYLSSTDWNSFSGYNARVVQLKTNGTAVQTPPLGAIDLNIISSPTIGYQATNSAGENEIQFNATAALALTTDLNNASNALKSAASMTYIPIQSGFANSLTGTNGTNIGPLTIKNATASRIAIFDGSQILSNAPALTAGQYLTFNGSSYVASNLPPSGSQTPWTSDINAAGFALSNAGSIQTTGTVSGSLTLNASNGNGAMNFSVQHNLPVAITNVFNFSNAAPGQVLSVISSNNFTVTWGLSNAPSGLPASPTNTIQYNNAGSFGAIANPNTNSWGSSLQWSGTGWAFRPLDAGWIMDEEFLGDGAVTTFGREAWRSSLAGSGAHASRTIAGDLGVVESVIFNAADQAALLIGNGSYITIPGVTNQEMYCLMRVQIWQTLTNSTDIGQVRCGIIDNANNSPANGIYWQNTNNCWEAVCGRSSSFTVGTTASNSVNGAWIYLAWYLNQTGTNVDFFIGTSTTNLTWTTNINAHIPDSQPMTPVLSFRKSVGSTKQTNYWGSYRLWSNPFTR